MYFYYFLQCPLPLKKEVTIHFIFVSITIIIFVIFEAGRCMGGRPNNLQNTKEYSRSSARCNLRNCFPPVLEMTNVDTNKLHIIPLFYTACSFQSGHLSRLGQLVSPVIGPFRALATLSKLSAGLWDYWWLVTSMSLHTAKKISQNAQLQCEWVCRYLLKGSLYLSKKLYSLKRACRYTYNSLLSFSFSDAIRHAQ